MKRNTSSNLPLPHRNPPYRTNLEEVYAMFDLLVEPLLVFFLPLVHSSYHVVVVVVQYVGGGREISEIKVKCWVMMFRVVEDQYRGRLH